jgi:Ser/Thr protein kinase RdoA (MazF antagonist)
MYRRIQADRALARRIGRALGGILAEQHACAGPEDVAGWLPHRLPWPEPRETLWATLPRVVTDRGLLRAIGRVLRRYEDATDATPPGDRVLLHGDLGLHNIAVVPGTDELAGVFDYDGAAYAGRHQDFRYPVFRGGVDEEMWTARWRSTSPRWDCASTGTSSSSATRPARSASSRSVAARRPTRAHAGAPWPKA